MAQLVSLVKETILHLLPKTEQSRQRESLQAALNDKTGAVFQAQLAETTTLLQKEKQRCIDELHRMNGSFYEDPKSILKKAWDKAASSYLHLEKIRNNRQAQLDKIVATEKASTDLDEQLKQKKTFLMQRHRELCGDYFADPSGQLHQAWTSDPAGEYLKLEEERKKIEAELSAIDHQLSISPSTSYTVLTEQSIASQIDKLSQEASVDWKRLAASAAQVTLLAAGYIIIS